MASSSSRALGQSWPHKLEEAQRLASDGARSEFAKDYSAAFAAYVRAGELYLWLARTYDTEGRTSSATRTASALPGEGADLKARIRKAAEKVLNRAQLIKSIKGDVKPVERCILSEQEQSRVLDKGATVGAMRIPRWAADPSSSSFEEASSSTSPYPAPSLAPLHIQRKAAFVRRRQRPFWADAPLCSSKRRLRGSDIVQDVINDCSFVAALEVAAEHDAKWGTRLAHAPLYPKDEETGLPVWSASGRHLVRLRFNGTERALGIDDAIPCDVNDLPMCAVGLADKADSTATAELWPALLEKAYLSLRGGYDFKGSNSSIDLHALTGWVPEHIGFHHAGFQREKMWARLFRAFTQGHILLTAATSKSVERTNEAGNIALIASHNYAVLDVVERGTERQLLLMNPWRRGGGIARSSTDDWTCGLRDSLPDSESGGDVKPEIFIMSWDEACSRLDALYASWNPALFPHSITMHAFWLRSTRAAKKSNVAAINGQNTAVLLEVLETASGDADHEIWIHLAKHVTEQESNLPIDWIAIHAFDDQDDKRVHDQRRLGTYVDSTHALAKLSAQKGRYLLVVSRQTEKGSSKTDEGDEATFTLTAHSTAAIRFEEVKSAYPFVQHAVGQWTSRTAGGNALQPTFMHNPQYTVKIPSLATGATPIGSTRLRIVVEADRDVAIQILLVWSSTTQSGRDGTRIDCVAPGDVVCSSGSYSYGLAIAETDSLRADTAYVLIVSTYTPGQEGDFALDVQTQYAAAELKPIPAEGAGMHQHKSRDRWSIEDGTAAGAPRHGRYDDNPTYVMEVQRATHFVGRLTANTITHADPVDGAGQVRRPRPHINLAVLEQNTLQTVVSSGPYIDNVCGVAVRQTLLEPGTYRLVASTFEPNVQMNFTLFAYADRPIKISKLV